MCVCDFELLVTGCCYGRVSGIVGDGLKAQTPLFTVGLYCHRFFVDGLDEFTVRHCNVRFCTCNIWLLTKEQADTVLSFPACTGP